MASKRILKKQVRNFCGQLAAECILSINFIPNVDVAKMREVIAQIAGLQESTLNRTNFVFDKARRDFDNAADYKKARNAYFHKAYTKLHNDFNAKVVEIVKEMNSAIPEETKQAMKQAAEQ